KLLLNLCRCQIPGLGNDTFELQGKWHAYQINQTIPMSEEVNSNSYDTCHVYSPGENNTKIECNSWVYDQSTFQDTFITKVEHTIIRPDCILNDLTVFNLVCGLELARANANMLVMAGMLAGSALVGIFADMFGRKRAFLCTEALLVAAMFGTAFAPNYQVLAASRFLAGFGQNTFLPVFSMAMELVGPSYRVAAGIIVELFWCVGLFILCLLAYFVRSATNLTLVAGVPMILVFLYIWLIPESPRWLISKGKNKEAYKIIQKIAKKNQVTLPENAIDEYSVESGESMSVFKMFTIPKLLIRTLIIYLNWE
ncbi:ORCT-like protein, partial [Mya arenaria]